jgi:NADH:ubiquinone oxidoreductase subunit 2 (subunit N)
VPFHFWIADIYEGSSWDVIILIAIISKISVIVVFLQLIINTSLIIICCLLSVILGTIGAINQTKLKRLLAYSAISNMGFIILGFTIGNSLGYEVSFICMFIYMVSSLFLFVTIISTNFLSNNFIIELSGLQYSNKILGLTWLLLLLSIAGVPPLSGFVGKWFVIWNTICFDYIFSSLVLILSSIIGMGFYLRIIKIIYFQKKSSYFIWNEILNPKKNTNSNSFLFLGFSVFFTILFIININPLINITNYIIYYLF